MTTEFRLFDKSIGKILSISRSELKRRDEQWKKDKIKSKKSQPGDKSHENSGK